MIKPVILLAKFYTIHTIQMSGVNGSGNSGSNCTNNDLRKITDCNNAKAACRVYLDKSHNCAILDPDDINLQDPDFEFKPCTDERSHLCSVPGEYVGVL